MISVQCASNALEDGQYIKRWIAILVMGSGISQIGDFVYLVAINLYVLNITHSALAVAGVWMVPLIAQSLVGGFIGSMTDRLSKRPCLIGVELLRAGCLFALPFVSILSIYPLLFVLGSASTFFERMYFPYRTELIPPDRRKAVNTWLNLFKSGSLLLGPAVAGALMQMGSFRFALWVDAISFVVSALAIYLLPEIKQSEVRQDIRRPHTTTWSTLRRDWYEAAHFLIANRLFLAMFIGMSVVGIFGQAADAQEVVYAEEALHLGQFGYSTYTQHAMPVESMGRINNLLGPPQQLMTLVVMALASVITNHYGVRSLMICMTCIMVVTGLFTTFVALLQRNRSALDPEFPLPILH